MTVEFRELLPTAWHIWTVNLLPWGMHQEKLMGHMNSWRVGPDQTSRWSVELYQTDEQKFFNTEREARAYALAVLSLTD